MEGRPRTTGLNDLIVRLKAEYREMPGLALTAAQAARLVAWPVREVVGAMERLVESGFLRRSGAGRYVLA